MAETSSPSPRRDTDTLDRARALTIDLPQLVLAHEHTEGNALMGALVVARDAIAGAAQDMAAARAADGAAWRDPLTASLPHAITIAAGPLIDTAGRVLETDGGAETQAGIFAWLADVHTTLSALDVLIDTCLVLGRAPNGQPIQPAGDAPVANDPAIDDDPFTP